MSFNIQSRECPIPQAQGRSECQETAGTNVQFLGAHHVPSTQQQASAESPTCSQVSPAPTCVTAVPPTPVTWCFSPCRGTSQGQALSCSSLRCTPHPQGPLHRCCGLYENTAPLARMLLLGPQTPDTVCQPFPNFALIWSPWPLSH